MKNLITFVVLAALATPAAATEFTIYDTPAGQVSADKFGDMTIYSDSSGREIMTSNKFGNITTYTAPDGSPVGSSTTFGSDD